MGEARTAEKTASPARQAKPALSQSSANSVFDLDEALTPQDRLGNAALGRLLRAGSLRPKLEVSEPSDESEREADWIAERLMASSAEPTRLASLKTSHTVQRSCATCAAVAPCDECAETEPLTVRRKRDDSPEVATSVHEDAEHLVRGLGSGDPLDPSLRAAFEPRLGLDFDDVRVHTSNPAFNAARALKAHAFTVGRDIAFASGKWAPETPEGKRLLAHELVHVAQHAHIRSTSTLVARLAGESRSGLVARSWIGDRIDWVRTATHANNWASEDPPGAYYVLNGLSMDDMVRVLRAVTPAERKKLSDNLDEQAAGFDRSRLQLALANAAAAPSDITFRETSEDIFWAIRSGNYANTFDGAFYQLAAAQGAERHRLLAALNRDALDELIAHRDEAEEVPGGGDVMTEVNRARGQVGPTRREQGLLDLIDGNDWRTFFIDFNSMNENDQLRFLRGNTLPGAQVMYHIGEAAGIADQDRIRYLIERATVTASTGLYVDGFVSKCEWQPKYKVKDDKEYSRIIRFSDLFEVELDINSVDDGQVSDDDAERQFREAKPGPGGFLWPAVRNRSTLPVLWKVKQNVRQAQEEILFNDVLQQGINVVIYIMTVVFPEAQVMAMRTLKFLERASVSGRWMKGSQVVKGRMPPSFEAPTPSTGVRTAPRVVDTGGGTIRAEWGPEGRDAVVMFRREGKGVALDYIRVREGYQFRAPTLFADALRSEGLSKPVFVESTVIINPRMQRLIGSGAAEDFQLAQRMVRVEALAFAQELGGTVRSAELVRTPAGNWAARVELSY